MKSCMIILVFMTCFIESVLSQGLVDKSADTGLMVRQIPNTESAAIKFFADLSEKSDTIYATIFRPANCPRCDGFLNRINSFIKNETNKPSVLIAVYPDSVAAKAYIDKYSLKADHYIYDTDESFEEFLSFSPGYLHVGYILKINKSTGELIVGSNADNVSAAFFKELNNYNVRKETYNYPSDQVKYHDWSKDWSKILSVKNSYLVDVPEHQYKISEIIYQPVFHRNRMLWNDKLAMSVIEFELNDSILTFKRIVEPDSVEYSKFVSLPQRYYNKLLRANQLKNIPLQPFIIDEDKYGVAYSLPELWLDEENGLNYRNKPCYIERSFSDSNYMSIVPLEYDFEDVFYYPHFNMKSAGDSEVVVGVQRITWPMVTDKNEYVNNPESNPFQDEFYDNYSQPTLATYKKQNGLLSNRFGKLPKFAKKTKTGYCFSDMVFDAWRKEGVYASAYDGNIFIAPLGALDCEDCQNNYEAFHIDEDVFQKPDSTDYYSYNCNAIAAPYLNRKIVDIKIDNNNIHCLIRNCTDAFERPEFEDYNYVIINRDTGQKEIFDFPDRLKSERRIAYGLRREDNGMVTPYYISRLNNQWRILTLAPSN